MSKFTYDDSHRQWVLDNYSNYKDYGEFAHAFNLAFSLSKSQNAVQQFATKYVKCYLKTEKNEKHYSRDEKNWLRVYHPRFHDYSTLTDLFNVVFKQDKSVESVREQCSKRLKMTKVSATQFANGHVQEQLPIGTVRVSQTGRYVKVLDSRLALQSGYAEPYWLPVQKKVWIDAYGAVPDGGMIVFLDGNRENLDLSNLYCIDRKISAVMSSNQWWNENAELTLTAIKWCELFYAIKQ
jgi:hypothetical protein